VVAPSRVLLARVPSYYSFDDRAAPARRAINAGRHRGAVPRCASRTSPRPAGLAVDRRALSASACARGRRSTTGFHARPRLRGFTVAWFIARATPRTAPPLARILGLGNWRIFHGRCGRQGAARRTGWGGAQGLDLPDDVQALASGRLGARGASSPDGDLGQAAWFVNGILRRSIGASRPAVPRILGQSAASARGSARRQGLANVLRSVDEHPGSDAPAQNGRHESCSGLRGPSAGPRWPSQERGCRRELLAQHAACRRPVGQIDYPRRGPRTGSQALLTTSGLLDG
jgi:hypothetical protein